MLKLFSIALMLSGSVLALPYIEKIQDADTCKENVCLIKDGCKCSTAENPIKPDDAPQFIAITISESIVKDTYERYFEPLFFDRVNPDGNQIGLTFYVNHEYTDYSLVQSLYNQGFEIGDHSITKNLNQTYWREIATLEDLIEEFDGQRQLIAKFANIPIEDIVGVRTPQLQLHGDLSFEAYSKSGLQYDNSWPTHSNELLFPYTLDYKSTQKCTASYSCPKESHSKFWLAPLTDIVGPDGVECNSLAVCILEGDAEYIAKWLLGELNKMKRNNRTPLVIRLDTYWFEQTKNSYEGFKLFLDQLQNQKDVFLISVKDVIEWVKNPVPLKDYKSPVYYREEFCRNIKCNLQKDAGDDEYSTMVSCVQCPKYYPWKGNPLGIDLDA